MQICFVCGELIMEDDDYVWFGCDGDKIHKRCKKNIQKACNWINNITDEEFRKYLLGESPDEVINYEL